MKWHAMLSDQSASFTARDGCDPRFDTVSPQPRSDRYRSRYRSAIRSTVKRVDTADRQAVRSISPIRPIASTAASTLSTRKPVTLVDQLGHRPAVGAMTGVPQASASTTDSPNGSSKLMRWSSARAEPRAFVRAAPPTGPR